MRYHISGNIIGYSKSDWKGDDVYLADSHASVTHCVIGTVCACVLRV